jgi:hypothetical protein
MDIRQAIDAHASWKGRLAAYLLHPDHSLDPTTIALDVDCELGKWLQCEGQVESAWPGFAQLVRDHGRFHLEAADLVRRADAGEWIGDETALGSMSAYAKASNAVITALLLIKNRRLLAVSVQPAAFPGDASLSGRCVSSIQSSVTQDA